MTGNVVVRNADWLVAYDSTRAGHVYLQNADLAFRGSTVDYAVERNLPFQTHIAQSVAEFHEMHRRHGSTPVGFLAEVGALGEHTILGHAIFLDPSPMAALDLAPGSDPHRRGRRHRRALPHRVRATRDHAAHVRRLQEGRNQPRGRHRHLSAQHPRGDALGRAQCPRDRRIGGGSHDPRRVRGGDARRSVGAAARRHRPARPGGAGRTSSWSIPATRR